MSVSLNNFDKLCNSIKKAAIRDSKQKHPQKSIAKWRQLLTAIWETEEAMHRVRSALKLLRTIPPKETLNIFSMSEGAWIDFQYTTWSLWALSLLNKEIELVSQVCQKLIKPSNPQYKEIERPLVKSLVSQKDKVGEVRHPLAHTGKGGVMEAIMKTDLWPNFAIIPSPVDFNEILSSVVPYHMRWYNFLYEISNAVLAEIERICRELNQHIDWDNI